MYSSGDLIKRIVIEEMKRNGATLYEITNYKFNNKMYSKESMDRFERIMSEKHSSKSVVSRLGEVDSELSRDFIENFVIPDEYYKLPKKKKIESQQLFRSFPFSKGGKQLSFTEMLDYWIPQKEESNGEWDFSDKDGNCLLELSDVSGKPGKIYGKIKREYPESKTPIFEHYEIFDSAKITIKRKLDKSTNDGKFCFIVIRVSAYDEENPGIINVMTRGAKFRNINKYHDMIVERSKEYMNFVNGYVIFVYGDFGGQIRLYKVDNNVLKTSFIKRKNSNNIMSMSLGNGNFDKEFEIFKDRIFKREFKV